MSRSANGGGSVLAVAAQGVDPAEPPMYVYPAEAGAPEPDLQSTRISRAIPAPERAAAGFYLKLDDGREVDLSVPVLLGRNPQRNSDDAHVDLVAAGGDARMISRTHLLVGTDLRGPFVVDRGSTNGTAIVSPRGGLEPCPAGLMVRVTPGTQVSYGDRWFTVMRRALIA